MKIKKIFGDLLIMSKAERNGSLVLIVLLVILISLRFLIPDITRDKQSYIEEIDSKIAQLESQKDNLETNNSDYSKQIENNQPVYKNNSTSNWQANKEKATTIKYFEFDPNTVSFPDMIKLGFTQKIANTLIRYRSSGAQFYCANDLLRVYGIDSLQLDKLKPYIVIATTENSGDERMYINQKKSSQFSLEINSADSAMWTKLPGIGPVFASRICNFRKLLGGFNSINQLAEVYKLPEETFIRIRPFLTIDTSKIEVLNLNFVDVAKLARHPYCNYTTARKIIDYRANFGSFTTPQQLLDDSLLSESNFIQLLPYLAIN